MRLDATLAQASSGLDSIGRRLSVIAQNVANADTAGYVRETVPVEAAVAGDQGMGVRTGPAQRRIDQALQADLLGAAGRAAGGALRQASLASIDEASGAPGAGQDLASLLGRLRDSLSALGSDPANATRQRAGVARAADLAAGVNALGATITSARQAAQDGLATDLASANAALATVGRLGAQIALARNRNESTADLEDKRDAQLRTLAELAGARAMPQPNGQTLVMSGGTVLPTDGSDPLSVAASSLGPGAVAPPLLVAGRPAPPLGGRIGAAVELRDTTLPALQASLDGFATNLAAGFAAAGLTLFTNPAGFPLPATGAAQTITVDPAVQAAPRMLRDGPGPAGPAGATALIDALLTGPLATGAGTLAGQAADLVSRHAAAASGAATQAQTETGIRDSLQTKLSATTAVTVDSEMAEMIRLQNSYGANARVISSVQQMWTQLLDSIR